jgi:hypothetical protein
MQKPKTAPCSDASLRNATGRDWKAWCALLDKKGARALAHIELARLVNELHPYGHWWSQMVAVGYERLTGKRKLYGRADGTFTANVSKTISAEPGAIYEAMTNDKRRAKWAPGPLTVKSYSLKKAVRLAGKDGTRVVANLQLKPSGKTVVAIEVAKLPNFESVALVKEKWRIALEKLAAQV